MATRDDLPEWERLLAAERHLQALVARGRRWAAVLADMILDEEDPE